MREWVNNVNLLNIQLKTFSICTHVISVRKAKYLDVTTMFTYSHANTPLGQSEHGSYLSYFIKGYYFDIMAQDNALVVPSGPSLAPYQINCVFCSWVIRK